MTFAFPTFAEDASCWCERGLHSPRQELQKAFAVPQRFAVIALNQLPLWSLQ